jgi:amidase
MMIADLGSRIADRLAIAGCVIALAGCNQTRVAEAPTTETPAIDVVELSATDARDRMASGALTSEVLTKAYLDRIAKVDDAGPRLDSVIEINPQAVADAAALDAERKSGKVRGPLHGIPILIKDNVDVAGMVNSAGSLALADNRPQADAFTVKRLRDAGAVILGKTNLSEWANFRSTRSSSGWSSRGGQTKNPYVLDRNPCGSSSGTGAAIAASLGAVGIGTETDGSIICPASVNGLAGLKPTVGIVSRSGIIPISVSQDTAGPMARTVSDVALLLTGMAGVDPGDPSGEAATGKIAADYTTFLKADALKGKRFGVVRQAMGYHPDVDASMAKAIDVIKAAGGAVIDVKVATYNEWNDPEFVVLLYEFKDGLNTYLKKSGSAHASLESLIAWNKANAKQVMPIFGQEIFEQAQGKGPLTDAAYLKARDTARRLAGKDGLIAALDRHRIDGGALDALIAPSLSPAWPTDHVLGDHFVGAGYGMAAVAGTPSLTVPIGDSHGLPLGVTFMGRPYSEGELIGFGFALEQATKARRAPQYAATLPVK